MAVRDISAGERISDENVALKRPGNGIQPQDMRKALGPRGG